MVRTRGGSCLRPRVRFSIPEQEEQALVPEPIIEQVPEEPQGFRRYQTQMGPRAPLQVPQRRFGRARPSKRARTSGPGESSSSRPERHLHRQQRRRPHRLSYRLPRGSGGRCSLGPRFQGTSDSTLETSMESLITTSWS